MSIMEADERYEVILIHTGNKQGCAVTRACATRKHFAMADPRQIHANNPEPMSPTFADWLRDGIMMLQEVDNVIPKV